MQQIFDMPKRERETDVQHQRQADDLGAGLKVFERGRSGHGQKLRNTPAPLKQSSSDKTLRSGNKFRKKALVEHICCDGGVPILGFFVGCFAQISVLTDLADKAVNSCNLFFGRFVCRSDFDTVIYSDQ